MLQEKAKILKLGLLESLLSEKVVKQIKEELDGTVDIIHQMKHVLRVPRLTRKFHEMIENCTEQE